MKGAIDVAAKLLGLEELTKTLSVFAEQFNCTVTPDIDFFCYFAENRVTYALVTSEKSNNAFMNRVRSLYPDINADVFLWSFLHEIGHIETGDEISEPEWKRISEIKSTELTHEVYFELPDEYLATEWAACYMRQHPEEISTFWTAVQHDIMEVYRLNGLVLE